jgi:predicted amidophosphoribosyltransferase
MTHACCPGCSLRVHASPNDPPPCPECGRPMVTTTAAESIGCRLETTQSVPFAAQAASSALPVPSSVGP